MIFIYAYILYNTVYMYSVTNIFHDILKDRSALVLDYLSGQNESDTGRNNMGLTHL